MRVVDFWLIFRGGSARVKRGERKNNTALFLLFLAFSLFFCLGKFSSSSSLFLFITSNRPEAQDTSWLIEPNVVLARMVYDDDDDEILCRYRRDILTSL